MIRLIPLRLDSTMHEQKLMISQSMVEEGDVA